MSISDFLDDVTPDPEDDLPPPSATEGVPSGHGDGLSLADQYEKANKLIDGPPGAGTIGEAIRDHLRDVVGVDPEAAVREGWRLYTPPEYHIGPREEQYLYPPVLIVPARDPRAEGGGPPIAFRALSVRYDEQDRFAWVRGTPPRTPVISPTAVVEPAPGADLRTDDVPTPCWRGLFDEALVWVSYDPVDALLLRELGAAATSLASPSETLGSAEGLRQLLDLGVLSHRRGWKGQGTLVVVDPEHELGEERAGLLRGFFEHVWWAPELTGRELYEFVRLSQEQGLYATPQRGLLYLVADGYRRYYNVPPIPLPPRPRPLGPLAPSPPEPLALESSLALAGEEGTDGAAVRWLVEGFVAAGAITELQGQPKAGKTTFALAMARAVAEGGAFLGRPCPQAPVIFVSEQSRVSIRASLRRSSAATEHLHVVPAEGLWRKGWEEIVAFLRRACLRIKARLVILDTLARVAGLRGEAENHPGTAGELFDVLQGLTFDGVGVVAVRHSRKAGGNIVETGRGSNALSGEVDQIVRVQRAGLKYGPDVRRIDAEGRLSDPFDVHVERTDSGWVLSEGRLPGEGVSAPPGAPAGAGPPPRPGRNAKRDTRTTVLETLAALGGLATAREIRARAAANGEDRSKTAINDALRALEASGRVGKRKTEARGAPYQYFIHPAAPALIRAGAAG